MSEVTLVQSNSVLPLVTEDPEDLTGELLIEAVREWLGIQDHTVAKQKIISVVCREWIGSVDTGIAEYIIRAVCLKTGISKEQLLSRSRKNSLVTPRHVAMYLVKKHTTFSYPKIAEIFLREDHTSIMYAVRKIESLLGDGAGLQHTGCALETYEIVADIEKAMLLIWQQSGFVTG